MKHAFRNGIILRTIPMNHFPSTIGLAQEAGQSYLTLLVRGQGQFVAGFAVDSKIGFALYFEGASKGEELRGHKRAQVEIAQGTPHLAIYDLSRPQGTDYFPTRELLVPCVDIIGLAVLDEGLEDYRDQLVHERNFRSLH
ncbi:MAG: hypothetical protein ABI831_22515 [Betaproteobacteria bacterium]